MIALLQRVLRADVHIDGIEHAAIAGGLLALVCAERGDTHRQADALAEKTVGFRMFDDASMRMNHSVRERGLAVLAVPQFTLAANTRRGTRASLTPAAEPMVGRALFEHYVARITQYVAVKTGVFGANMQVALINDGPVTFWLRVEPEREEQQ